MKNIFQGVVVQEVFPGWCDARNCSDVFLKTHSHTWAHVPWKIGALIEIVYGRFFGFWGTLQPVTQVFFLQMHLACPLKHRLHMTTLDKKSIQNTKQQNQTTYFFQMQECSLDPLWRGLNLYSRGLGPQTGRPTSWRNCPRHFFRPISLARRVELWKLTAGQKLKRPEFDGFVIWIAGLWKGSWWPGLMSWGKGGMEGVPHQFPFGKETNNLPLGCLRHHPNYAKFITGEISPNKKYEDSNGSIPESQGPSPAGCSWKQPELKRLPILFCRYVLGGCSIPTYNLLKVHSQPQ